MTGEHELLLSLAAVLDQVDPVPDHLAALSEAAFCLRVNDFVLLHRTAATAGMRSGSPALRFVGPTTTVDLQLHLDGRTGLHALGLVHPAPKGCTAVISWPGGERTAAVDPIGWFSATGLPAGPLRVLLRRPGSPDLSTGWFVG